MVGFIKTCGDFSVLCVLYATTWVLLIKMVVHFNCKLLEALTKPVSPLHSYLPLLLHNGHRDFVKTSSGLYLVLFFYSIVV